LWYAYSAKRKKKSLKSLEGSWKLENTTQPNKRVQKSIEFYNLVMENSAAHWCKSVVEQVVQPTVGNVYSSQTTTNVAAGSAGFVAQNLNPQYMQMYQEFYKQQAAAMSGQNYIPTSSFAA
jgi:hypothetical protein